MEEKSKYYGILKELQEIRMAIKYLSSVIDNLVQQQKENNPRVIAEQLTFRFTNEVEQIVNEALSELSITPEKQNNHRAELHKELNRYKQEYIFARNNEEREKLRCIINSIMNELNNYY